MSMDSVPQSLNFLLPYLRIALDHDNRDSIVSYYVRMFCVQRGIGHCQDSPENQRFLSGILGQLEKDKIKLSTNDIVANEQAALQHISQYAVQLFLKADDVDRVGRADKSTSRVFMTAAFLFDVCELLGNGLDDELVRIRKIARVKCAQTHNALNTATEHTNTSLPPTNSEDKLDAVQQAQKLCKFTISALQHEDVNTAVDYLQKSLSLLSKFKQESA